MKKKKPFDCVEMKNKIQAQHLAEYKGDMKNFFRAAKKVAKKYIVKDSNNQV